MSANSQVARNQSRQTFDSVYESTNPLTTVAGQHMVEWFTGNSLNTDRWGIVTNASPTFTATMADEIGGGLKLYSPTSGNYSGCVAFNDTTTGNNQSPMDIRPFSHTGAVCIFVAKFDTFSNYSNGDGAYIGFAQDANQSAGGGNTLMGGVKGNDVTFTMQTTNNAGNQTRHWQTTPTADTNYHTWRLEAKPTTATMGIDGVLERTTTDTLPEAKMGINMNTVGDGTNTATTYVRYIEAYNT